MKNPHPLSNTWTGTINKDPILITVPGTNKKFKRKSRDPKRLKTYLADMSDVDLVDDIEMDDCNTGRLAPLQQQLMMSQDVIASTTGILSGLPEGNLAPTQSSAIDMRIGINLPAIPSQQSQLPSSTLSNPELTQWPTVSSQPLSSRLKLGLSSTFPLPTSTSSRHSHSTSHQAFSLKPALSSQTVPLPISRASQTFHCHEHVEPQVQSPKVNAYPNVYPVL